MRVANVLLPGNMCDARLWSGGEDLLPRALSGHVVQADLTQDDAIASMATRTLRACGGDLLLIGFSMGAIVALEMARQAPERVPGLVLMGLNATADLPERSAHRPVQQAEVRAGGLERVLVQELKPNYLAEANRGEPALLSLLRQMGMDLGPDVFVRQSEALRTRADLRPALRSLNIPVLLIAGAEDALCPPEWHRDWARITPKAELHIIPGAGHMLPLEAPGPVATLIGQFAKEIQCPS